MRFQEKLTTDTISLRFKALGKKVSRTGMDWMTVDDNPFMVLGLKRGKPGKLQLNTISQVRGGYVTPYRFPKTYPFKIGLHMPGAMQL